MTRVQVESSMISAVGYDEKTRTLEVTFNSGSIYRYHNVPPEAYEGLLAAGSKGSYMNANIIDCYPDEQVRRKR